MTRRLGLAAALCLTTIVGFAVIVLGRQAGFFGSSHATQAQPLAQLPSATAPVPASPTPIVIEQYIYRDQYIPSGPAAGNPAPADSSSGQAAQPPATNGATAQPPASFPNTPASQQDPTQPNPSTPEPPPATPATTTEFQGRVTAMSGNSVSVSTSAGQTTVYLSASTNVHGGILAVGVSVHVHSSRQSDGTLLATEIQVSSSGEGDD